MKKNILLKAWRHKDVVLFNVIGYILVIFFSICCVLPFLFTLAGSFTDEKVLMLGLKLIPDKFSTAAYSFVLKDATDLMRAYGVTIGLVAVGTSLSLFLVSMTAYVLQRPDFRYRNKFAFFFFFTTLFSGGLVPSYILYTNLGLRNTFWAMVMPGLFSVFNMIIVRTYFRNSIPDSIDESAKIDGANDFIIYFKLYLPLAMPVLATVGLFSALAYWNEWYNAMLYISDNKLHPLQYFLYKILNNIAYLQTIADKTGMVVQDVPQESVKLAMTMFTIGPVVLFYPFAQKYFVQGMTIGAVKG